jgi:hypothetical protein
MPKQKKIDLDNLTRQEKKKYEEQARERRDKWGVPDWRESPNYPPTDGALSLDAWRWEFLRRNESYRRDWEQKVIMPLGYGLKEWISPAEKTAPQFYRGDNIILDFLETDPFLKELHYDALAAATQTGAALVCQIDLYKPFKAQKAAILKEYEARREDILSPGERAGRPGRKNNNPSKQFRTRSILLRVLDAHNDGVSVHTLAGYPELLGPDNISEATIRRSIKFAKNFWHRL